MFMTTIMAIHIHGNDGHNLSKASKTHKVQNCDIRAVLHSYVFFIETDILYHADWNEYEKLKTSIEEEMFGWGNKVRHKEWPMYNSNATQLNMKYKMARYQKIKFHSLFFN